MATRSFPSLRLSAVVIVVVIIVELLIVQSSSFVYPHRREGGGGEERSDEKRATADKAETLIRELEEMEKRRQESQLEEMMRTFVQARLKASSVTDNKRNPVHSSYDDVGDRVDYASSDKQEIKSFGEEAALPRFPA